MSTVEIKVPDIGGHENVDIIAVEVKAGDTIALDDTLITLETDKATMDVPADAAGVVKEVKVQVGGKVSEGDVIAIRYKLMLSHSFDHRVVNGALGGMFVQRVAKYLEQWDVNREI